MKYIGFNKMTLQRIREGHSSWGIYEYARYVIEKESEKAYLIKVELLQKDVKGEIIGRQTEEEWIAKGNCELVDGVLYVKDWAMRKSIISFGFNRIQDGEAISIEHKKLIKYFNEYIEKANSRLEKIKGVDNPVRNKQREDAENLIVCFTDYLESISVCYRNLQ